MGFIRVLGWLVWLVVFIGLLLLAVKNAEPVTLRFYFGWEWSLPLILVVLAVFMAGAAMGLIACVPALARQRREITVLARQAAAREVMRRDTPAVPAVPDMQL